MAFNVIKEIKFAGSTSYNLTGNDNVLIKVKGVQEFKYDVPNGRNGVITITITGLLSDPEA